MRTYAIWVWALVASLGTLASSLGMEEVRPVQFTWLWDLLDHNHDGRLDTRDVESMPDPFRAWWLAHVKAGDLVVTKDAFVKLAPRMMADVRAGRVASAGQKTLLAPGNAGPVSAARRETAGSERVPAGSAKPPRRNTTGTRRTAEEELPAAHRAYDRDGDGQLSTDEWPTPRWAEFAALDLDRDGFITPRELARPREAVVMAPPPAAAESRLPVKYRPYDRDGDGQIGLHEWPPDRLAEFAELDANGDGFVAPSELGEPMFAAQPQDPSRQAQTLFTDRARSLFRLADRDRDGRLSESEWLGSSNASLVGAHAANLRFPLSVDDFIAVYLRANPSGG